MTTSTVTETLNYLRSVVDERAPSDIDIEAGTNDAPWHLQVRDAVDTLEDALRAALAARPQPDDLRASIEAEADIIGEVPTARYTGVKQCP